jgi:hypothetical protein
LEVRSPVKVPSARSECKDLDTASPISTPTGLFVLRLSRQHVRTMPQIASNGFSGLQPSLADRHLATTPEDPDNRDILSRLGRTLTPRPTQVHRLGSSRRKRGEGRDRHQAEGRGSEE